MQQATLADGDGGQRKGQRKRVVTVAQLEGDVGERAAIMVVAMAVVSVARSRGVCSRGVLLRRRALMWRALTWCALT